MNANSECHHRDREWWAVYTRHQHEKSVVENLSKHGLETFLPLYSVVRQWKDRKKNLSLPLFPCYVFLRGSSERRVQILSTPGVRSIVSMIGRPAAIPEGEIEAIRTVVGSSLVVEPHPFLCRGDWVRIKSGPLAEIEGILIRRKGSSRLILSAELLQKSIAVEVDAFDVEALAHQAKGFVPAAARAQAIAQSRAAEWQELADRGFGGRLP
jgi:transcription antitermination factor NusG